MKLRRLLAGIACLAAVLPARAATDLAYVDDPGDVVAQGAVVVDARPAADCLVRSLAGARCLPAGELAPHGRLSSWRDLLWLLGTAGLTGAETVLVAGADARERNFVAGLLHLCGQRRVLIARPPLPQLLAAGLPAGRGSARAFARGVVFEAPMRDRLIVLAAELAAMPAPPLLLDLRPLPEFQGKVMRATRAGHIPGARPADQAGAVTIPGGGLTIAYGNDAVDGIAGYARLRAGAGLDVGVMPEGWRGWAARRDWPVEPARSPVPLSGSRSGDWPALLLMVAALAAALFGSGHWLLTRVARRS